MCLFYLKRLDEGPEQDANGLTLPEQLNQTGSSEEPQETQVDEVILHKEKKREKAGERVIKRSGANQERERDIRQ